jgi:hypothetical protein
MSKIEYKPQVCECCHQTTTYLLPVDRGTVDILYAIATAIYNKGINVIHPRKEMEDKQTQYYDVMIKMGKLTSNQVGNLSRPRFHGLIAKVRDNPGNYCLTKKGADFLKGKEIPRFAIISKSEGHQIGYFEEERYTVTIKDFNESLDSAYWEGINFDIVEGQIVKDLPIQK